VISAQIQQAVADCIAARTTAIDSDPQLASLTLVVQLDDHGVRAILYRTESRLTGIREGVRFPKTSQ
jgi:hypothetical protein